MKNKAGDGFRRLKKSEVIPKGAQRLRVSEGPTAAWTPSKVSGKVVESVPGPFTLVNEVPLLVERHKPLACPNNNTVPSRLQITFPPVAVAGRLTKVHDLPLSVETVMRVLSLPT